jgi:general secretion pathway protein K
MSRRQHSGFVLPLTIAILTAITLVAVYLAEQVQKSLQLARARQQNNEVQLELANARSELLFRLASQPMSPCGLGSGASCVALDDRPYAHGASWVRLQDARGLLGLQFAGDEALSRLLATYGIEPQRRAVLVDVLRDYTDADNLRRLNGAEAREYAAAGLPPPRNAQLMSPLELRALLAWRDEAALWRAPSLADFVTVGPVAAINPNTAPEPVLRTLPGVTPELARALVERRQLEPVSAELLDRMVGGGLLQMPAIVIAFPADTVRITQGSPGLPWALRYNVQLTPRDPASPWKIAFFHRVESSPTDLADARASRAPLPARPTGPVLAAPLMAGP